MNTGAAIKEAVLFLQCVHQDLFALVQELDLLFERQGYASVQVNRITDDLGNGSRPEKWVLRNVFRLYAPAGEARPQDVVGILIKLAPEETREAMLLTAAVRYPDASGLSGTEIWDAWMDSSRIFRAYADVAGVSRPTPDERQQGFFPGSSDANVFFVPLADLQDSETVRSKVVTPALSLLRDMRT